MDKNREIFNSMVLGGYRLVPDLNNEPQSDYLMREKPGRGNTVWITAGNISVWVRNHEHAVSVELYPLGSEAESPIDTATAAQGGKE